MSKKTYITLGRFLKYKGIISNGGHAKFYLRENKVLVNNEEETRRGRKLYQGDIIKINNKEYIVDG